MIISVVNQKGGVGKTTTVSNLAYILAEKGLKVLMIDLDPQGNLTSTHLDREFESDIYDVLMGKIDLKTARIKLDKVDLIPASLDLANAEQDLTGELSRESILKLRLKEVKKDYDVILIDCQPSLGLLVINAMVASDSLIIPVNPDAYSANGLFNLIDMQEKIKERLNPELDIMGILITQVDNRTKIAERFRNLMQVNFGDLLFETEITQNQDLTNAQVEGKSIIDFNENAKAAAQYRIIAEEVLKWISSKAV